MRACVTGWREAIKLVWPTDRPFLVGRHSLVVRFVQLASKAAAAMSSCTTPTDAWMDGRMNGWMDQPNIPGWGQTMRRKKRSRRSVQWLATFTLAFILCDSVNSYSDGLYLN